MKRFIIACCALSALAFLAAFLHFQLGLDLRPGGRDPVDASATFTQEGKRIYRDLGDGPEPFEIRGVELGAGLPGHFATDFAIDRGTYLRWFGQIRDLGANCIRIRTVLGTDFYEALHEFNDGRADPLYLIHGVSVGDYAGNSHLSAHDPDFIDVFKEDVRTTIDVCHGARPLQLGRLSGSGVYTRDVSPWVIGYILGTEWEPATVAFTDLMDDDRSSYQGSYLRTTAEATPFEAMLAEVGDEALAYETARYGEQRLVSFANWPRTDPNEFPEVVETHVAKCAAVDVEHVRATGRVKSGLFASYAVFPSQTEFLRHLPDSLVGEGPSGAGDTYRAYFELLDRHHGVPLVVSAFGAASSRGRISLGEGAHGGLGGMGERQQALALIHCLRDIADAGCAGCVVSTWQDEWHRRSWNTWTNVDLLKAPRWSDVQTVEQGFGLLAFDPGAERSAAYVDGDPGEWTDADVIGGAEGLSLSLRYDERFVYLLARGDGVGPDAPLYLPIDVTPKTGATRAEAVGGEAVDLAFGRAADFLLLIDGEEDSRLLVQERYEVLRATKLRAVAGVDPFDRVPDRDGPVFRPIYLMLETPTLSPAAGRGMPLADLAVDGPDGVARRYPDVYETGRLVAGNANPASPDFDSLADLRFGEGLVEVRLPWQLLNFSNPSDLQVHDDYYERYGVENLAVGDIWVGVGRGGEPIGLFAAGLEPWGGRVSYHERLKESYDLLRAVWSGGRDAEAVLEEARMAGTDLASARRPEAVSYWELHHSDAGEPR